MTCPACGCKMRPDEVQGWMFGSLLVVSVRVCTNAMCRVVVLGDWHWKARAQEATR